MSYLFNHKRDTKQVFFPRYCMSNQKENERRTKVGITKISISAIRYSLSCFCFKKIKF